MNPWITISLLLLVALLGAVLIGAAGLMALAIATSPPDQNRRENLARCWVLAALSILLMIPLLFFLIASSV